MKYDRNVAKNQSNYDIIYAYFLKEKMADMLWKAKIIVARLINRKSVQAKLNLSLLRQYMKKHSNN